MAVAQVLAERGASVILTWRTVADLDKACADLRTAGNTAEVVPGDVGSKSDVQRVVDVAVNRFGGIDIRCPYGHPRFWCVRNCERSDTSAHPRGGEGVGPDNICVNLILPAGLTESTKQFFEEHPDVFDEQVGQIPLPRIGDPVVDIGWAVAALVSDDLAYLTGTTLALDGGVLCIG